MANVFFDITIDGQPTGRIVFKLFDDIVPEAARNFRELSSGEHGFGYKGNRFHGIYTGQALFGGYFGRNQGAGTKTIYGGSFPAENFTLGHGKPGTLSMVTFGKKIKGSQFFITTAPAHQFDGRNVVCGEVIDGMDTIKKIESVGSQRGRILKKVVIADCGIVPDGPTEFGMPPELHAADATMPVPHQVLGSAASEGNRNSGEPPTSRHRVLDMVEKIVTETTKYKSLLESRDQKAEMVLDVLQKLLDYQDTPENLRRSVVIAMMRLCKASGIYPRCLTLRGIKHDPQPLASGSFGEIWKGYYEQHPVCLKVARVYASSDIQRLTATFAKEAIVWNQLSHPNVLPFYGIYHLEESIGRVCLVSPWMEEGNVCDYLKRNPEAPRLPLVFDTLEGLSYLHRNSIVHGDLKGANVVITPSGSACLADFGLSSVDAPDVVRWTSLSTVNQSGGTMRWEAPELLDETEDGGSPRPSFKSDVYSIACVMYEILTGQIPFHEVTREATVIWRVISGIRPTKPSPSSTDLLELTDDIWRIMQMCWSANLGQRPTVDEALHELRQVLPSTLTSSRIAMWHCLHPRDSPGILGPSSPWTFRTALREREDVSESEVRIFEEILS
ncbi:hypothetical protein D9756_009165 [Leucocoprinus leucothites]|uniref:peptidylprolyl isomerase n=1 Tax=Leucocoprinus leucothites TaxID=201217 RepID=A0A8H5FU97_9AGAR|nr:hypothetical protein D9756_009165 [Leucoagaricus leucothites]